ncbi:hypothetical protein ACEN9F_13500 [Duganella sp. CT11-25]|uniref:hypothetical protein n=1 Tax=unclassified Duganella TaxID=2636909 RepID=UPI0039AF5FE8
MTQIAEILKSLQLIKSAAFDAKDVTQKAGLYAAARFLLNDMEVDFDRHPLIPKLHEERLRIEQSLYQMLGYAAGPTFQDGSHQLAQWVNTAIIAIQKIHPDLR